MRLSQQGLALVLLLLLAGAGCQEQHATRVATVNANKTHATTLVAALRSVERQLQQPTMDTDAVAQSWQAAQQQWQYLFAQPTSPRLNRQYNQLQVSYQLFVSRGDNKALEQAIAQTIGVVQQR